MLHLIGEEYYYLNLSSKHFEILFSFYKFKNVIQWELHYIPLYHMCNTNFEYLTTEHKTMQEMATT
jgi:hypothetical protein